MFLNISWFNSQERIFLLLMIIIYKINFDVHVGMHNL